MRAQQTGVAQSAATPVQIVNTPEALSAFQSPDCAAAIWQRPPSPGFRDWIDRLDPARLPRTRMILRPEEVSGAVTALCDAEGMPEGAERTSLIDDIATLADVFAGLMHAPFLRLRLDVVTTNACRKFHIDALTARLICTYRGTGTQYGFADCGAEPQQIFIVPTGAPILLRGTLWPTSPPAELLHRSPPIEGTGETRLVLVLDPISDPDEEL